MDTQYLLNHGFKKVDDLSRDDACININRYSWAGALYLAFNLVLDIGKPNPREDGVFWGDDDGLDLSRKCNPTEGYVNILFRNGRFTVKASSESLKKMGRSYVAELKLNFKKSEA